MIVRQFDDHNKGQLFQKTICLMLFVVVVVNAAYLNFTLWTVLPAPQPFPDTNTYLGWSLFRTPGYPMILSLWQFIDADLSSLHLLQLNLMLAAFALLSVALARMTQQWLLGALFFVVSAHSHVVQTSIYFLTESIFASALTLHFSLLIWGGLRNRYAIVISGIVLGFSILIKSVAIVFIVPLILFALRTKERKLSVVAVAIASVFWALPATTNKILHGSFDSSVASGYAFAGHVATMICTSASDCSALEYRIAAALDSTRTELAKSDDYVATSRDYYNEVLWDTIVPIAQKSLDCCEASMSLQLLECRWGDCSSGCVVGIGEVLGDIAVKAITENPSEYALHVVRHFLAMWNLVSVTHQDWLWTLRSIGGGLADAYENSGVKLSAADVLTNGIDLTERADEFWGTRFSRLYLAVSLNSASKTLADVFNLLSMVNFPLGFIASLLIFRRAVLSPTELAFCYTGLVVNAYCLGHALAQPALMRYALPMQPIVLLMWILGVWLIASKASNWIRSVRL